MHLDLADFQRSEVLKRLYRLPLDFLEVCWIFQSPFFQFGMMNWMYNYRFVFLEELSLPPPQTYLYKHVWIQTQWLSGWRMLFLLEGLTALILGPFAHLPMVLFSSHPGFVNIWVLVATREFWLNNLSNQYKIDLQLILFWWTKPAKVEIGNYDDNI